MPFKCSALLTVSISINISVGIYIFLTPLAKKIVEKSTSNSRFAARLSKLFSEKPAAVRKFFRDEFFSILLFLVGLYLISCQEIFENPFLASSDVAQTVFAVDLGNYVYKSLQDFFLRKETPLCRFNMLHHAVTVLTYAVFLYFQQNTISGVMGLLFEGSMAASQLLSFFKILNLRRNSRLYICASALDFILTVFLRAVCPLTIYTVVIWQHDPLKMDYVPLGFFFMNMLFFLMLNAWLITSSFTNLRRRLRAWKGPASRPRVCTRLPREQEQLNNSSDPHLTSTTVIIPSDQSFRLSCPVSNVNLDASSSSGVSNIVASKRERTLPAFDTILIEINSKQDNSATQSVVPTEF